MKKSPYWRRWLGNRLAIVLRQPARRNGISLWCMNPELAEFSVPQRETLLTFRGKTSGASAVTTDGSGMTDAQSSGRAFPSTYARKVMRKRSRTWNPEMIVVRHATKVWNDFATRE